MWVGLGVGVGLKFACGASASATSATAARLPPRQRRRWRGGHRGDRRASTRRRDRQAAAAARHTAETRARARALALVDAVTVTYTSTVAHPPGHLHARAYVLALCGLPASLTRRQSKVLLYEGFDLSHVFRPEVVEIWRRLLPEREVGCVVGWLGGGWVVVICWSVVGGRPRAQSRVGSGHGDRRR